MKSSTHSDVCNQEKKQDVVQVIKRLLISAFIIQREKFLAASIKKIFHSWFSMACHTMLLEEYLVHCVTLRQHRM